MIPCGEGSYVGGRSAVIFGCGTIGIAAAVALQSFSIDKIMLCDHSDFRLKPAESLSFTICNPASENFEAKAREYFGAAPCLSGMTADIDCWVDAAGQKPF